MSENRVENMKKWIHCLIWFIGIVLIYGFMILVAVQTFAGDDPNIVTYYLDDDNDTYGDPESGVQMPVPTPPDGYVTNNLDCNDTDASVYPGQPELCDNKDNDCDGNIDEEVGTATYYFDGDGDGFGVSTDTRFGCSQPDGYVSEKGDCNDSEKAIHPGAIEICGDRIDQDCSGSDWSCDGDTRCISIESSPLSTQIKSAPPMIMFLLDDSGSMKDEVLCPEKDGAFNYHTKINRVKDYWKSQYYAYNGIYYNPASTYTPWVNHPNADSRKPRKHPLKSSTETLSKEFTEINGVSIPYAHWYMWSAVKSAPYLVILKGQMVYYRVSRYERGNHGKVYELERDNSPPSDVISTRTYDEECQNFANWFQYYRYRELAAKSALAIVIDKIQGAYVGIHTINGSQVLPVKAVGITGEKDNKDVILNTVYQVAATKRTPLRKALYDVGKYYQGKQPAIGPSPFASDAAGGACQQAFVIVMTDGYYNGRFTGVGNADGNNSSGFDGHPFGDTYSNTLADIAMHYYETDLSPLNNIVPPGDGVYDTATHQHMVTHAISFGLTGELEPDENCPSVSCPKWPDPKRHYSNTIDDLWHATVNGRGLYLSAKNTEELTESLSNLLETIQLSSMTGAAVSVGAQSLETGTTLYQGFLNSTDWSGDLKAYDIKKIELSGGADRLDVKERWSAADKMPSWESRTVLSFDGKRGVPFRYGALSSEQKLLISTDSARAKAIVDYIRGDTSNEKVNSGRFSFRNRSSLIGDIVNSSPVLSENGVYIGANDGMLHGVDADTGKEMFGYVPSFVMENLYHLADINYKHQFFVNTTPSVATDGNKKWLVCGLGRGGRGYFGIDITHPTTISESAIPTIWEYPLTHDDDMGYSYSDALIVRANNGISVAIFGNGYDSKNGRAVLYFLNVSDGSLIKTIDTGVGNSSDMCNGLSTPVPIDVDFNGTVDYLYAGDLLGNLWKFDVRSSDSADWCIPYYSGSGAQPLFQARDQAGNYQPITSRPAVMKHPNGSMGGFIVVFGTGRFLTYSDIASGSVQALYGIWDWADAWIKQGETANDKYFGYQKKHLGSQPSGGLSGLDGNSSVGAREMLTLLKQVQTGSSRGWREMSQFSIDWFSPKTKEGCHVGWFFDLPNRREKIISRTQIADGKVFVVSMMPSDSPCTAGGESILHIISAANGGEIDPPQFDTNDDGVIDEKDEEKAGKVFGDTVYYDPAIVEDRAIMDKDETIKIREEASGLYYWRFVD